MKKLRAAEVFKNGVVRLESVRSAEAQFSADELKDLIEAYPYLDHLKNALVKKGDFWVYVASCYDTLLNKGFDLDFVFDEADKGLEQARKFFKFKGYKLFSPVLEYGGKTIPRAEAMKKCLNDLKDCDFLFIPNLPYVNESLGVAEEIKFAKKHNIPVLFECWDSKMDFLRKGRK